jgi:hypothetical protein
MKRNLVILVTLAVATVAFAAACGDDDDKATPTAAGAAATAAATPTKAELATFWATSKTSLQLVVDKAKAGDEKATKDAFEASDKPMEAIIKAVRPLDAALADGMETRELEIEKQADAAKADLAVMGKDAAEILPLLEQAATKLQLTK